MNVILNKRDWEPSELRYVEQHLGAIVSINTPKSILISRTPGGYRWYAWDRKARGGWTVVAESLEEMVREVLEKEVEHAESKSE